MIFRSLQLRNFVWWIIFFIFSVCLLNIAPINVLAESNDTKNSYCSPPLEKRIEARNLLEKLDIKFTQSQDRFLKAVHNNDVTLVKKFLQAGIIPEVGADQFLRLSIETGSERLMDFVLECVDNKTITFDSGNGPIHRVAKIGDTTLLKRLHEAGFSLERENDFGMTPYMIAKRNNNSAIRNFLLQQGVEKPELSSTDSEASTLSVQVNHTGESPNPEYYDASGNDECGVDQIEEKSVVVNSNGTLKNVVVALISSPKNLRKQASSIKIDQKNCEFRPHVRTIQTGGTVKFLDSDPQLHNIRGSTQTGEQLFNLMTFEGQSKDFRPERPQILTIQCDVHPWMEGYIYVTDHGYADVTGESGIARLQDLPPGNYELTIWHEKYGRTSQSVELDNSSDTITVDLPETSY